MTSSLHLPSLHLVVFTLDGHAYALELATVHRVVRAVEVTPLPNAPALILGVINVQGELMPVVNLRRRFRLPERAVRLSDQLIIAGMTLHETGHETTRKIALWVDAVRGIRWVKEENIIAGEAIGSGLEAVQGIAKVAGDLIVIHNLERCLSLHEARLLDDALAEMDN